MAQRVGHQVAQRQAQAQRVDLRPAEARLQGELDGLLGELIGHQLRGQRCQVGGLGVQRGVAGGQALAFDEVGDQVTHLGQVVQQRGALIAFGQQLGVQPRAGERAAQFMADGQQQQALGLEHAVQALGHVVDARGEVAELVAPAHLDRPRELALAEGLHTARDVGQRAQQPAHRGVGHGGERQQHRQRDPTDAACAPGLRRLGEAEGDAVAVGGVAHQAPVGSGEVVVFGARVAAAVRRRGLWVGAVLQQRPVEVQGDGQACGQGGGARAVGLRADLGHQAVEVVVGEWFGVGQPAALHGALQAVEKGGAGGERQQHEEPDQPGLDRVAPALPRFAPAAARVPPAAPAGRGRCPGGSFFSRAARGTGTHKRTPTNR